MKVDGTEKNISKWLSSLKVNHDLFIYLTFKLYEGVASFTTKVRANNPTANVHSNSVKVTNGKGILLVS